MYLRILPDPVLRQVCDPVQAFDSWLEDIVAEMFSVMNRYNGCGLAAPQVGINQRLFIAQVHHRSLCLINPEITRREGRTGTGEACLSVPQTEVYVPRNLGIEVEGFNCRGQKQHHCLKGFWARVVQHEMDHLNGILIIDYQNEERV